MSDTSIRSVMGSWFSSLSEESSSKYRRVMRLFVEWVGMPTGDHPEDDAAKILIEAGCRKAKQMIVEWRDRMFADGKSPSTVAGFVSSLVSAIAAARSAGLLEWTVEGVMPLVRRNKNARRKPSRADLDRLLAHIDEHAGSGDEKAIRDAAIIRCIRFGEMKRGSVSSLEVGDASQIRLSVSTSAAVAVWMSVRGSAPGALFHRLDRVGDRSPLSGESIRQIIAFWCGSAGVPRMSPQDIVEASRAEVEQVRQEMLNV